MILNKIISRSLSLMYTKSFKYGDKLEYYTSYVGPLSDNCNEDSVFRLIFAHPILQITRRPHKLSESLEYGNKNPKKVQGLSKYANTI